MPFFDHSRKLEGWVIHNQAWSHPSCSINRTNCWSYTHHCSSVLMWRSCACAMLHQQQIIIHFT